MRTGGIRFSFCATSQRRVPSFEGMGRRIRRWVLFLLRP